MGRCKRLDILYWVASRSSILPGRICEYGVKARTILRLLALPPAWWKDIGSIPILAVLEDWRSPVYRSRLESGQVSQPHWFESSIFRLLE